MYVFLFSIARLADFELCKISSAEPNATHVADLSQNAAYVGGTKRRVMCLLKNTLVWSLNEDHSFFLVLHWLTAFSNVCEFKEAPSDVKFSLQEALNARNFEKLVS